MTDGASCPCSRLRKRHNVLSFHCVCSQTAQGCINLKHIRSHNNASDILSKHWGHQSVKALLKPFFNTMGNTANLCVDDSADCLDGVATTQDGHTLWDVVMEQIKPTASTILVTSNLISPRQIQMMSCRTQAFLRTMNRTRSSRWMGTGLPTQMNMLSPN